LFGTFCQVRPPSAVHVDVVTGDLKEAAGRWGDVHRVGATERGALPAPPAILRLEQSAVMPEEEVLRVSGIEGDRMDISRSQRRPGGGPTDGRLATPVQNDGQRDDRNGGDRGTTHDEGAPGTTRRRGGLAAGVPAALLRHSCAP